MKREDKEMSLLNIFSREQKTIKITIDLFEKLYLKWFECVVLTSWIFYKMMFMHKEPSKCKRLRNHQVQFNVTDKKNKHKDLYLNSRFLNI